MKRILKPSELNVGDWVLVVYYNSKLTEYPTFQIRYGKIKKITECEFIMTLNVEVRMLNYSHKGFTFKTEAEYSAAVPINLSNTQGISYFDVYSDVKLSNELILQIIQDKIDGYMTVHVEVKEYEINHPLCQYWQNISGNKYRLIAKDCKGGEELGTVEEFKYPDLQQINVYDKRFRL